MLKSAPFAALFGAAAALVVYVAARSAGVPMMVPNDLQDPASGMVEIGVLGVLLSSVFPAFAGAIALALLTRTSRPMAWFFVVALVLVSMSVGPLLAGRDAAMARIDVGTRSALAVMHVARAAAVMWVLARAFLAGPSPNANRS